MLDFPIPFTTTLVFPACSGQADGWTLKQVQGDEGQAVHGLLPAPFPLANPRESATCADFPAFPSWGESGKPCGRWLSGCCLTAWS